MPEPHQTIPLPVALRTIDEVLGGVRLPTDVVPVRRALGRTAVGDYVSRLELPPFDKAAMDGFAVMAGDERDSYQLLETVPAGAVPAMKLRPGTATKVMTGAPLPEGTGKVIVVEDTSTAGETVRVRRHGKAANVCVRGEDVRVGDLIVGGPAVLGPIEIANLIACGVEEVEVSERPRVSILATGSEIADSAAELCPGKIMNSNGPMLAALCRMYEMDVVGESIVPDERRATAAAIRHALDASDIVVLSGGVSVGDFDFVCQALGDAGLRLHFGGVSVKPGRPAAFAAGEGKAVFGLPGNPVSVYLGFHLFVLRAVRLLAGSQADGRTMTLPLAQDYRHRRSGRTAYVPFRLSPDGEVMPVESHGSADIRALLQTDGFFVVPEDAAAICAGERVALLLTGRELI